MKIGKCPAGCWIPHESSLVYGVGIHPEESSICRSAIVDKAIPLVGGIIGINILTGMNFYDESGSADDYFGLAPKSFGVSKKSFTTFKIDNIDFCTSDLRIIDSNGEISNEGRVEMRNNGLWGSVCAKNMNSYAARVICR